MLKELITLPLKFSLPSTPSQGHFFGKTASRSYSDNNISFSFFFFFFLLHSLVAEKMWEKENKLWSV